MKYLFAGNQSKERLDLLLSRTDITSPDIIQGLHYHFVRGMSLSAAAAFAGVPKGNLSRNLQSLNEVAEVIEKVKELDFINPPRIIIECDCKKDL
jgi:hypothetical protein